MENLEIPAYSPSPGKVWNNQIGESISFIFSKGVEHSACTMDDPPNGVPWCKVGENGTTLIYDDCNMETCKGM